MNIPPLDNGRSKFTHAGLNFTLTRGQDFDFVLKLDDEFNLYSGRFEIDMLGVYPPFKTRYPASRDDWPKIQSLIIDVVHAFVALPHRDAYVRGAWLCSEDSHE